MLRPPNNDPSFYLKPQNKASSAGWGYSTTALTGVNTCTLYSTST